MADELGESFRQARRELRFQLITWTAFAVWVVGYCAFTGFAAEKEDVEMMLGMPSWVVLGIGLPWVIAFGITVWFAGWFMKDTELRDGSVSDSTDAAPSNTAGQAQSAD